MLIRNLFRPVYIVRRIAWAVYERAHPDNPWLAPPAVRFLERNLRPEFRGFEWGSGRSTVWFARRVAHLTSVEHDEEWHRKVSAMISAAGLTSADLRLVPLEHEFRDLFTPYYDPLPAYVRTIDECPDESLDFALVDGYYRQPCALRALKKLKPGGLMIIDNTNWMPRQQWPVPLDWPQLHQSKCVMTTTTIWQKPVAGAPLTNLGR